MRPLLPTILVTSVALADGGRVDRCTAKDGVIGASGLGPLALNRSVGVAMPRAWCGRAVDPADAAGIGPLDQPGHDTEPGVVIDAGHDLELLAVDQPDPAHHIQLPQLYRPIPLPPPVVGPPPAPGHRLDQPLADQRPVDRRPRQHRLQPIPTELVVQPPRPPIRVPPPQLADPHLASGTEGDCGPGW
jgi:hypothetical protein